MEFGEDTDTDTDTSSDSGNEVSQTPGIENMSQADASAQIYLEHRRAKKTWRRFTGKPVRKCRRRFRFAKKSKGKGKGKGRQHGARGFMWTHDDTLTYLKGKGKGHRSHTSGKGFGRRGNPKDRDGNVMKCRIC